MRSSRLNTFETNSSSCHVLTLITDDEVELLKSGKALLRVTNISSDDDRIGDSEVIDKARFIELCIEHNVDMTIPGVNDFIDYIFACLETEGKSIDTYNYAKTHNIESDDPLYDAINDIEDWMYECFHEESIEEILRCAKKKEINGKTVYTAVWEKYC